MVGNGHLLDERRALGLARHFGTSALLLHRCHQLAASTMVKSTNCLHEASSQRTRKIVARDTATTSKLTCLFESCLGRDQTEPAAAGRCRQVSA